MPLRYAEQAAQVDTLMMVRAFLATCNWNPRSVEFIDTYDGIDQAFHYGDHTFHSFMSHVDDVQIHMRGCEPNDYPESLRTLWLTSLSSSHSPLKRVCFSACVTNLGNLIHAFIAPSSTPSPLLTDHVIIIFETCFVKWIACHLLVSVLYCNSVGITSSRELLARKFKLLNLLHVAGVSMGLMTL